MNSIRTAFPSTKTIFLDSNILVLLIVGQVRPNLLQVLSPGNISFAIDDFELIKEIILEYGEPVTTPYILSEVSSLLNKLDHNSRIECLEQLSKYIPLLDNQYTPPEELSVDPLFSVYGIADISILSASEDSLVLTEDNPLIGLLQKSRTVLDYHTLKQVIREQ